MPLGILLRMLTYCFGSEMYTHANSPFQRTERGISLKLIDMTSASGCDFGLVVCTQVSGEITIRALRDGLASKL